MHSPEGPNAATRAPTAHLEPTKEGYATSESHGIHVAIISEALAALACRPQGCPQLYKKTVGLLLKLHPSSEFQPIAYSLPLSMDLISSLLIPTESDVVTSTEPDTTIDSDSESTYSSEWELHWQSSSQELDTEDVTQVRHIYFRMVPLDSSPLYSLASLFGKSAPHCQRGSPNPASSI